MQRELTAVPKAPLKDLQSFPWDHNVTHLATSVVFQSRSAFCSIAFKINNCRMVGEKRLNGFAPWHRGEVSAAASGMWKWVNRLPSCLFWPLFCFCWSLSSWLIRERNNALRVKAARPRQSVQQADNHSYTHTRAEWDFFHSLSLR